MLSVLVFYDSNIYKIKLLTKKKEADYKSNLFQNNDNKPVVRKLAKQI